MSAISPSVQAILDLFAAELSEVRFADLDAKTLTQSAADVQTAAEAVVKAELALETATSALQERQEVLLQQAQRALAYARVFAESRPELSDRLDAIALPRTVRRSKAEAEVGVETVTLPKVRRTRASKSGAATAAETIATEKTTTGTVAESAGEPELVEVEAAKIEVESSSQRSLPRASRSAPSEDNFN